MSADVSAATLAGVSWPRLVAHVDPHGAEVAIERSDRRLAHRRRLVVSAPGALAGSLKAYMAAIDEPATAGAIVVDGHVEAGRFQTRTAAHGLGIESLRIALGLQVLRVVDERAALCLSSRTPTINEVGWLLPPRIAAPRCAVPTAVCLLGGDGRAAMLACGGRSTPSLPPALMSHPFAPVAHDELIVVSSMRARGLAPVFANLLGTEGLSRAFEALAGIDFDWACPLPAEAVVSLAARDDRARRACAVICAAVAQMSALLSFDGIRRVLLAGRAATLLAPALRLYPIEERLRSVRAEAAQPAADLELGILAEPIRFLDGARATLDLALQPASADAERGLAEHVGERYSALTVSSQRVADLVLDDPSFVTRESISRIAAAAGVGPSQVSRFCRSLGLRGLGELKLRLAAGGGAARFHPLPGAGALGEAAR